MMGLGWQEFIIIGISLMTCIGSLLPVVILVVIVRKRRESRAMHARDAGRPDPSSPSPQMDHEPNRYATKYGFDASDWHSEFDDNDGDPHIVTRR